MRSERNDALQMESEWKAKYDELWASRDALVNDLRADRDAASLDRSELLAHYQRVQAQVEALQRENERLKAPVSDEVLEELAELEHDRWSSQAIAALTDMTEERRARWTRQARMLYAGLSEAEKEQDRAQVRKTLRILASRATQPAPQEEPK
jgi:hypothetical protein